MRYDCLESFMAFTISPASALWAAPTQSHGWRFMQVHTSLGQTAAPRQVAVVMVGGTGIEPVAPAV